MIRKSCEKSKKLIKKLYKMFIKSKTRKISIHDADVVSEEENEVSDNWFLLFFSHLYLGPFKTKKNLRFSSKFNENTVR